tara:strand:+ start:655 stop:987 length:333 start_codon:yes stop_codon:yes gene_type:complete
MVCRALSAMARAAALSVLFLYPCHAGLDSFTELDRVNGWLIERKQGADGTLRCRAFLPSGASWFSSNIHLDAEARLVVPAGLSFKGEQHEIDAVREALNRCSRDLLYLPL